ncbi:sentrin-specific protease 6-like [Aphis craccivora]|uniref:Sentrin-specific protease 6-like n=1 Tax=Aphis craccivora TaxID=307492 RepID=A0A6G0X4Q4_APHCR|nr:sentrin-specific protease 6-like [Aphis craccivora]
MDKKNKHYLFFPIHEDNHWFMAIICFPYLSNKVNMEGGTPVNEPDDDAGRYLVPPIKSKSIVPGRTEADPNVKIFDHSISFKKLLQTLNSKLNAYLFFRPCILVLDSLSGGVHHARITATLRDWLEQEYIAKHPNEQIKDLSPEAIKGALLRLSQQPNSTDCGLFMIHYFV